MSTTTDKSFIRAYNPQSESETMKPKVTAWTVQSTGTTEVAPPATSQVVVASPASPLVSNTVSVAETHYSLPDQVAQTNRAAARIIPKTAPKISGHPSQPPQANVASAAAAPPAATTPAATTPAATTMSTGSRHYRLEPASTHQNTATIPTPHFLRMQRETAGVRQATQPIPPQAPPVTERAITGIRPQWEVDQFRWPAVCDVLQDTSSHRLEDVVASMTQQSQAGNKVVAVTSFDRKEGRSTIAMSLARLAAKTNLNIALVDGDLDEPSLGSYLGISFDTSWNHIDPKLPLGEAAIVSVKDRFVVFPAGQDNPFPERTVRNNAGPLLATLCDSFDLVFIDVGPIFTAAHRWFMPESCNLIRNALVVRDVRRTSVEQVDDACCRLVKAGIQNMAIIDNFQID